MVHGVLHRAQQRVRACPRPAPARLVCLLGPPRQHSAGLSRASHGQLSPAAAPHRDTASCQGSTSRIRDVLLRCLSGCGFSQRGWLTCASVPAAPRAVASVCWPRQGQSLGRHGSRSKSCPSIFPHRPAASPAHPAARPAAHTAQSCQLAPGTQGGQHTALCSEEKGSNPTQSLSTAQGCSELALLDPNGPKDSPQQPRPARRLHQDAPPHASLAVTLHHSPGHLYTA